MQAGSVIPFASPREDVGALASELKMALKYILGLLVSQLNLATLGKNGFVGFLAKLWFTSQ